MNLGYQSTDCVDVQTVIEAMPPRVDPECFNFLEFFEPRGLVDA
jgi:hypothetical protein